MASALHSRILSRPGPSPLAEDQLIRDLAMPAALVAPEFLNLELLNLELLNPELLNLELLNPELLNREPDRPDHPPTRWPAVAGQPET